jgi:predicted metal-binding protein
MTLLICRTCPRYDPRASGEFGRRLTAAITEIAPDETGTTVAIRNVQCLGGCPVDGVAAVDGPQKARVRFTGLDESDATAVLAAALAHDACLTGAPDDWEIPAELADRISSVTFKRAPRSQDGDDGAPRLDPAGSPPGP